MTTAIITTLPLQNPRPVLPLPRAYAAQLTLDAQGRPTLPSQLRLIFDTETTGLVVKPTKDNPHPQLSEQPYITQLSWVLFDDNTYDIYEIDNFYIKTVPPTSFTQEAIAHTGITPDICFQNGIDIVDAIYRFICAWTNCNNLIGHNIEFDILVLTGEIARNWPELFKRYPEVEMQTRRFMIYRDIYLKNYNERDYSRLPKPTCCTMFKTWRWCAIPFQNGRRGIKWPKLIETYNRLFRESPPEPLHNAIIDTLVCLRCYLKFVEGKDIHNAKFARMVKIGADLANVHIS